MYNNDDSPVVTHSTLIRTVTGIYWRVAGIRGFQYLWSVVLFKRVDIASLQPATCISILYSSIAVL
jgi:hypothetical protein